MLYEAIGCPPRPGLGPEGVFDCLVALENLAMHLALVIVPDLAAGLVPSDNQGEKRATIRMRMAPGVG
jgi:hypothetical protein